MTEKTSRNVFTYFSLLGIQVFHAVKIMDYVDMEFRDSQYAINELVGAVRVDSRDC